MGDTKMKGGMVRKLARNAVSNYARQFIQIITFVLLTPFIISKVGTTEFGLWSLIQATIGLLGLLDLGFANAVVKYIAEARGKEDAQRIGNLTATFFWLYCGLAIVVTLITICFVPFLEPIFGVPKEQLATAQIVFLLIGLRSAQSMPLGLFVGILTGFQQQISSNFSRTFGTVSYALLAWWGLEVSPSLEMLAVVSLLTGVVANLIAFVSCMKLTTGVRLSWKYFKPGMLREITSFSLYFFLIQISLLLATRVDTIVVNAFLPLSAVALYTVAIRVAEKAGVLSRQLGNTMTPMFAELHGAGNQERIHLLLEKGSMFSLALSLPIFLGLLLFSEPLLILWMGEEFRAAVLPCQLLSFASLTSLIHSNAENVLSMTGHQRFLAFCSIGTQVANLILTLILIQFIGMPGVALATVVATLTVQLFFIQRKISKLYGLTLFGFYKATLGPNVIASLLFIVSAILLMAQNYPTTLLDLVIMGMICTSCFAIAFYFTGLTTKERDFLRSSLSRRKQKKAIAA
jgi:O-antigen/teichoic acid export membrane protein